MRGKRVRSSGEGPSGSSPFCFNVGVHLRVEADQAAHTELLLSSSRQVHSRDKDGLARPTLPVMEKQSFQVIFRRVVG
jgi:hypothetical protein